jgi:hypothetical protein
VQTSATVAALQVSSAVAAAAASFRVTGGPRDFSALGMGAMAKGEGWRRSSLARLVSHLPLFPSAYDFGRMPAR